MTAAVGAGRQRRAAVRVAAGNRGRGRLGAAEHGGELPADRRAGAEYQPPTRRLTSRRPYPREWYLYIGQQPLEERISVKVLSLFEALGFLAIDQNPAWDGVPDRLRRVLGFGKL